MEFLTGTKHALDRYILASQKAAEAIVQSGDTLGTASVGLCEGEDSNLHGSYPASTSSSGVDENSLENEKSASSKSAGKREPDPDSGDGPHWSPATWALGFFALGLGLLPANDTASEVA